MPAAHHELQSIRGNLFGHDSSKAGGGGWATERTFGYTMAVALVVLQGFWWLGWYRAFPPLRHLTDWAGSELAVVQGLWWTAAVLAALALVSPAVLWPLNRLWTALGDALGAVMGRVILALVYYLVVAPIGLLVVRFSHDPMRRRLEPDAPTYWQPRERGEFQPQRCERQS